MTTKPEFTIIIHNTPPYWLCIYQNMVQTFSVIDKITNPCTHGRNAVIPKTWFDFFRNYKLKSNFQYRCSLFDTYESRVKKVNPQNYNFLSVCSYTSSIRQNNEQPRANIKVNMKKNYLYLNRVYT